MDKPASLYQSSVGQKVLVALTGLFLCTFLVVHLSGNLLLFKQDGGRAFDGYSEFMSTNLGIRFMEFVLAAGFLGHILLGIRVWMYNRRCRPESYVMSRPSQNSSLAARVMFVTGSVVFVFLVVHLKTFFLVSTAFADPVYAGFYLVSLALMGYHLRHGFQSAFQTLGLRPHRRTLIDYVAMIFWLFIPAGYAAMPVYFLWAAHWARAR